MRRRELRELVSAAELHVIAAGVETVPACRGGGRNLKRNRTLHFRVALRRDLQHVIGAQVHDHKFSTGDRSEEHTSELQSRQYLVCRLLLEKKKQKNNNKSNIDLHN